MILGVWESVGLGLKLKTVLSGSTSEVFSRTSESEGNNIPHDARETDVSMVRKTDRNFIVASSPNSV
jgi:hypothetical protein